MNRSEMIGELAAALALAQAELHNPPFDSTNPHFKSQFASLAGVRDCITPALSKHGIAVMQLLGSDEGRVTCETVLAHKSGQWVSGTFSVSPTKQDPQAQGSAASYARRYSLMAIINVVGDRDDDGNEATSKPAAKPVEAVSQKESAMILDSYREAAMGGTKALEARHNSIPSSKTKDAVWKEHRSAIWAAAGAADKASQVAA